MFEMQEFSPWMLALLIVIVVNVVFIFRLYRNNPHWLAVIKAFLIAVGVKKKIDDDTLDEISQAGGYAYDAEQDIFYSRLDAWQRSLGYCRLYDEAAAPSGMIIDCEPITFTYDDRRWLIEFWKGQYGLSMGAEIGVYVTKEFDLNVPGVFTGAFYESVGNKDLLQMFFSLKKNGEKLFARQEKHWWLTGFRLGHFAEPYELGMDLEIVLKDGKMRDAFVKGLVNAGYTQDEIVTDGCAVRLEYYRPRTEQPITRTEETDRLVQMKNKKMCDMYQEIAAPHDRLVDKINAVLQQDPKFFKQGMEPNRGRAQLKEYKRLKRYNRRKLNAAMSRRLSYVFHSADEIAIDDSSRIILMSDCHRSDGSFADDFARNRNLYLAALNQYYDSNFTYIEIGDGDDLWEHKRLPDIINVHRDVFKILSKFYEQDRLYFIFGNHDMVKKNHEFVKQNLHKYYDELEKERINLFEDIKCHEGLVLRHEDTGDRIFLTHGHQVDFLDYNLWKLSRFMVRHLWKPLNLLGINDPTRAAKNYAKKKKIEERLTEWVRVEKHMLISGHTHRPMFPEVGKPPYFNGGSSVHPNAITGIEIVGGNITLVMWSEKVRCDGMLQVKREVLAEPRRIKDYLDKTAFR